LRLTEREKPLAVAAVFPEPFARKILREDVSVFFVAAEDRDAPPRPSKEARSVFGAAELDLAFVFHQGRLVCL
jgi:hypothetical protein